MRSSIDKHEQDGIFIVEDKPLDERKDNFGMQPEEGQSEDLFSNILLQLFKFFGDNDVKVSFHKVLSLMSPLCTISMTFTEFNA